MAASEWNAFSLESFRAIAMEGQAPLLRNPNSRADNLVQTQDRIDTLRGGRARRHPGRRQPGRAEFAGRLALLA